MTGKRSSRRCYLKQGLAIATVGIAGCTGPAASLGSQGPISGTSINGRYLSVELGSDHNLSEINLVAPDGSAFRTANVETGASAVKLPLLDVDSGEHYSPGDHEVVAVRDGEEVSSTTIDLRPDLRVLDVEQYSGGEDSPQNRANLLVTVENTGTAPTWVYYLAYEGTPSETHTPRENHRKNSPSKSLEKPESSAKTIVSLDSPKAFLGKWPPFRFSGDEHCREMTVDFTLTVYSGVGENIEQRLRATLSGEKLQELHRVTCTEISIEMIGDGGGNE